VTLIETNVQLIHPFYIYTLLKINNGSYKYKYAVSLLIVALRYKSRGRGFDSRWCHWNFSFT